MMALLFLNKFQSNNSNTQVYYNLTLESEGIVLFILLLNFG